MESDKLFDPFPEIETHDLSFKKLNPKDSPDLFKIRSNNEVMKYILKPKDQNEKETAALISAINNAVRLSEGIYWGIFNKADDQLIGAIGFNYINRIHKNAEIGYLISQDYWGKGIGTKSVETILKFGFSEIKLHRIEASISPDNLASKHILKKLGFELECFFEEHIFFNGKFESTEVWAKLNS